MHRCLRFTCNRHTKSLLCCVRILSADNPGLVSIPRNSIPRISNLRGSIPRISIPRSHRRVEFTHKSRVFDLVTCIARLTSSSSGNLSQSTRENYTFRCLLCN